MLRCPIRARRRADAMERLSSLLGEVLHPDTAGIAAAYVDPTGLEVEELNVEVRQWISKHLPRRRLTKELLPPTVRVIYARYEKYTRIIVISVVVGGVIYTTHDDPRPAYVPPPPAKTEGSAILRLISTDNYVDRYLMGSNVYSVTYAPRPLADSYELPYVNSNVDDADEPCHDRFHEMGLERPYKDAIYEPWCRIPATRRGI